MKNYLSFFKNNHFIFFILLLLLAMSKAFSLLYYGFKFTGSDDVVFWQMANDYSYGVFHEPYFYGQNYNFPLEALFAAPLVFFGMPVQYALPFISVFIGVFPFVFIAFVLFKRGFFVNAYIFLVIPITMPIEYDLITSFSRGFTTGLFFTSFLIYPLLEPQKIRSFWVLGLFGSLGFVLNPNSILFIIPIALYVWTNNVRQFSFYWVSILPVIPVLILKFAADQFYVNHVSYLVHEMWLLRFSFTLLAEGISYLDRYFRYLNPVFWPGNWIVILVILGFSFLAFIRNRRNGTILFINLILCVLFVGINKVNDEISVIFLSSTRMFLAIPLVLGLSIFWAKSTFEKMKLWNAGLLILALFFVGYKLMVYPEVVKKHTEKMNFGPVAIEKLDVLQFNCSDLKNLSEKYNVDLVVLIPSCNVNVPRLEFLNYGCPILDGKMRPAVMNLFERRTWVYEKEYTTSRKTVLLYNFCKMNEDQFPKDMQIKVLEEDPNLVLIENNSKTLSELSVLLNFELKRSIYR